MAAFIQNSCVSTSSEKLILKCVVFPNLPPTIGNSVQPGLAGPIAGAHGNFVMVAGGANFENGLPWRGGEKKYHNEIYLLEKSASGNYVWKQSSEKLPFEMAYPACISSEKGIISVGGETENGPVDNVFLFSIQEQNVVCTSLSSLPRATTSAGVALVGQMLYVTGGLTADGVTSSFYSFNLKQPEKGWQILPELPVALSHSVVVSQEDSNEMCIYVIGGRNKTSEVSTFHSSVWKYTPSKQKWTQEAKIISEGKLLGLSAGTGIAAGSQHIVLFGGDPGIFFNRTERMNATLEKVSGEEKQKLWNEKDSMLSNHSGFSKDILAFNTRTKEWEKKGNIDGESAVTTTAFFWNGTVVIPSGEIRPGVRTKQIIGFDIQIEK